MTGSILFDFHCKTKDFSEIFILFVPQRLPKHFFSENHFFSEGKGAQKFLNPLRRLKKVKNLAPIARVFIAEIRA